MEEVKERLARLENKVDGIANDVHSLLQSRAFLRGAWATVVAVAGIIATLATLLTHTALGWVKPHG